jgi:hypothetical protein
MFLHLLAPVLINTRPTHKITEDKENINNAAKAAATTGYFKETDIPRRNKNAAAMTSANPYILFFNISSRL